MGRLQKAAVSLRTKTVASLVLIFSITVLVLFLCECTFVLAEGVFPFSFVRVGFSSRFFGCAFVFAER
jgi:hypothetical protein